MKKPYAIGIDIGGTNTVSGLLTLMAKWFRNLQFKPISTQHRN